ncbi:MAG: hypothetical protein R3E08_12525 [Thiotrichaceae bacterium]
MVSNGIAAPLPIRVGSLIRPYYTTSGGGVTGYITNLGSMNTLSFVAGSYVVVIGRAD